MAPRTVIHRDNTFEYRGRTYQCTRGGPVGSGDNYFIWDPATGHNVAEDFDTLADIRAYVDQSRQNDWPLEES